MRYVILVLCSMVFGLMTGKVFHLDGWYILGSFMFMSTFMWYLELAWNAAVDRLVKEG